MMNQEGLPPPAREVLKSAFGFDSFRGFQEEVIQHVTRGGDALVLMPTGGGKSLCYQLPALLRPGVAVVISPLIALMQDQVESLRLSGIKAAFINSSQSQSEINLVEEQLRLGQVDLLYVAPERIFSTRFFQLLQSLPLALFAIDEAHCVSQWGHDFRPEYIELGRLQEYFPQVPRLALTATAAPETREDMLHKLGLEKARVFVSSFDRPNLCYRIKHKDHARRQLLAFIRQEHPGEAGIIYCLSRKSTETTAEWLREQGVPALAYHAGLPNQERKTNQQKFLRGEGMVMVATIAFGMGIDKPNVRFVVHLDLPKSMENYYQETGRAGRDGSPADVLLLYNFQDVAKIKQLLMGSEAPEYFRQVELKKLDEILAFIESPQCRRQRILGYFGQEHGGHCKNCDSCLEPPQLWEGSLQAQKALSCVFRTGQRFGVAHLVGVLLGKASPKILDLGHDRLSTYGIGQELSSNEWKALFRQLLSQGYLAPSPDGTGGLVLTQKAKGLLKGQEKIWFRRDPLVEAPSKSRRRGEEEDLFKSAEAKELYRELKELRRSLAAERDIPVFWIFSNATLQEMVRRCPHSLMELGQVSGVGETKLERYGQAFLDVLGNYQTHLSEA